MLERVWRKGNSLALLVGMEIDTATMETVGRFLKKLKIELPYDPAIPLLGIYPEKTITQRLMYQNVHFSPIYNSQGMEAA